jgi:hypothetical protein
VGKCLVERSCSLYFRRDLGVGTGLGLAGCDERAEALYLVVGERGRERRIVSENVCWIGGW